MADINFQNSEQSLSFMLNNLRLSRVDFKFIESLLTTSVSKKYVTTNQVALFKKIVYKYRKQFTKNHFDVEIILNLPWVCKIIESSPEHTEAHINIENNQIILKAPYNKNYITAVRKENIYSLEWNKETRCYQAKYSTETFKTVTKLVKQHYQVVNFCPTSKSLLDKIESYSDIKYWNPTLTYLNGGLYICAINQSLMDSIDDIKLELTPQCISDLVSHGISIDNSVLYKLEQYLSVDFIKFVIENNPVVEITEIDKIVEYLHVLGCDAIYEAARPSKSVSHSDHRQLAKKYNIDIVLGNKNNLNNQYKKPVLFSYTQYIGITHRPTKLYKVVRFVNSQPIDLNERMYINN